jgi:hypothetical protein
MPPVVSALLAFVGSLFRSHISLHLEHLALAASAGRLSANCPPSTAPPHGSPVLGVALTSLAWLGRRPGLRPAPYGHHMAVAAVP